MKEYDVRYRGLVKGDFGGKGSSEAKVSRRVCGWCACDNRMLLKRGDSAAGITCRSVAVSYNAGAYLEDTIQSTSKNLFERSGVGNEAAGVKKQSRIIK